MAGNQARWAPRVVSPDAHDANPEIRRAANQLGFVALEDAEETGPDFKDGSGKEQWYPGMGNKTGTVFSTESHPNRDNRPDDFHLLRPPRRQVLHARGRSQHRVDRQDLATVPGQASHQDRPSSCCRLAVILDWLSLEPRTMLKQPKPLEPGRFSTLDAAGVDQIRQTKIARLDMSSGRLEKAAVRVAQASYGPEINTRNSGKISLTIVAPSGEIRGETDRIRFNTTDKREDFSEVTYFLTASSLDEFASLIRDGVERYGIDSVVAERWISSMERRPGGQKRLFRHVRHLDRAGSELRPQVRRHQGHPGDHRPRLAP